MIPHRSTQPDVPLTRGLDAGATDPSLFPFIEGMYELSGRPYEITPNGKRLMESDLLTAQQECFLRSLASYRIPSALELNYTGEPFSPLRFVLNVFNEIEGVGENAKLSFQEFSLFVQTSTPIDGANNVAGKVIEFRNERLAAAGRVRAFDRRFYEEVSNQLDRKATTLNDYADLSFRYLKATGLFRNSGRGIAQTPAKRKLADLLAAEQLLPQNDQDYLKSLWSGASLPTDNVRTAATVVASLAENLRARGVEVEPIATDAGFAILITSDLN